MAIERFELDTEQWAVVPRVPTVQIYQELELYTTRPDRLWEDLLMHCRFQPEQPLPEPRPEAGQQPDPRPVPSEETGWLIENGGAAQTLYRCINNDMGMSIEWTPDPDKALRFARKEDAQAFAYHDEDAVRIAEHMWCGDAPRPVPTSERLQECEYGNAFPCNPACEQFGDCKPIVRPAEPNGGAV